MIPRVRSIFGFLIYFAFTKNHIFALSFIQLRLNRAYSPTHVEASTKPNCASMDAPKSPLQPIPELTHGFEKWTMPGHNGEKKFWRGTNVGDRIAFQVQLVDGVM